MVAAFTDCSKEACGTKTSTEEAVHTLFRVFVANFIPEHCVSGCLGLTDSYRLGVYHCLMQPTDIV